MGESAVGAGGALPGAKDADTVFHRAVAQFVDAKAAIDGLGKGDAAFIETLGVDDIADSVASVDIQAALPNQVAVGHGGKVGVVVNTVDMAIDIVVQPAGGDGHKPAVAGPLAGIGLVKVCWHGLSWGLGGDRKSTRLNSSHV